MKVASLVFFYFGEDSKWTALAQETVPLGKALEGYEKSVLLHHQVEAGPFEVSALDEKHATIVDVPTKENLVKYLNLLGSEGYAVDLYIFSHGSTGSFRVSKGTYGDNGSVTGVYLERNVTEKCLRMVWGVNCYGASLAPTWTKLGARVSAGARYVQFYPNQFSNFISLWKRGARFGTSVSGAATVVIRTATQTYLLADAAAKRAAKQWGGCDLGKTILGTSPCAQVYFQKYWLDGPEWQEGKSGRENMNFSSFMVITGDRNLLFPA